ncbi:hypothetical protein FRC03_001492 [Tulasnella sp. 419]|nr:hypothetical protein FRC03_001492 [Tulasnella sp. 419]
MSEEHRRAAQQILFSDGYIDLRSIYSVRRAESLVAPVEISLDEIPRKIPGVNNIDDDVYEGEIQGTNSDNEDVGGEDGLNRVSDKTRLRLRRMFELVMRSGLVVRFEASVSSYVIRRCLNLRTELSPKAHSCSNAVEWISRLRALISYWTRRHRVDARQEMDIAMAERGRINRKVEGIPDVQANSPYLGDFWNWCIIDGCRPVIRSGRLFAASGVHKQFKHKYHVLTHGHLVQYHITSVKSSHHHRSKIISLIDAYVFSGQLAVTTLPHSVSEGSPYESTPKRYQDGLEAEDSEEDVTFIIWYRPHTSGIPEFTTNEDGQTELMTDSVKMPSLSSPHKVLVLKARSKLERDAWCFALNCEIERIARSTVSRERRMRDAGNIR